MCRALVCGSQELSMGTPLGGLSMHACMQQIEHLVLWLQLAGLPCVFLPTLPLATRPHI
jgi:hypothetical protein